MNDPPRISVVVSSEQPLDVDEDRIAAVAGRVAEAEGASGEISILFVDIPRIAEMNRQFLDGEGPTDVLSFAIDGLVTEPGAEPVVVGEVVICPEVAAAQARAGLDDELDLLVAHGVLHLLGHDHDTEQGAARMRKRERLATGQEGARAS